MAMSRIKNKREVSDAILEKFGTFEKFSEQSGLAYELIVDGLVSTGFADEEFITALQDNGIRVEL